MLPDHVQAFIDAEMAANRTDFSDLRAPQSGVPMNAMTGVGSSQGRG